MGKYGYNENVGTQHVRLVTKGDTMANKKVKVYTYKWMRRMTVWKSMRNSMIW